MFYIGTLAQFIKFKQHAKVEVLYILQAQVTAPGGQNHHTLITSQCLPCWLRSCTACRPRSWFLAARITTYFSPFSFTLLVEVLYSLQAKVTVPGGQNHHTLITSQFYLVG
jgi:hypothetical protein